MGALGCRGMRRQANKASKGPDDQSGYDFSPYGRGNLPKRHVWRIMSKKCIHACRWIFMDLCGCSGMRGDRVTQEQGKKRHKQVGRTSFVLHDQGLTQGETLQRRKLAPERIMGENNGEVRGIWLSQGYVPKSYVHRCTKTRQKNQHKQPKHM